jgi:cytoskeletal protein CcmA (bactofilin family)
MAWFDRSSGGKKSPEEEKSAPAPQVAQPAVTSTPAPSTPAAAAAPPEPPPPVVKKEPPPPPAPAPAEPDLVALLHNGCRVNGQLVFQGAARIDGHVEGEIQCHGKLTIGEGAEVRAKISSQVVIVRGRVEGNITAKEKVELIAPARLFGNVNTPRLTITEGVVFDGDCSMGMAKPKGGSVAQTMNAADKAGATATLKAEPEK